MSFTLPIGTRFAIATAFGEAKSFSGASNASAVVLSYVEDPGYVVNDILEVTNSGWEDLKNVCSRVSAVSGSGPYLVTLAGVDTTNTIVFPAAEGAGTTRKVSTWTNIPLIGLAERSGGEVEQHPVPLLARRNVAQLPGAKSGIVYRLPVYFEQPMNAGYLAAEAAEGAGLPVPLRRSHPAGDVQYSSAYWAAMSSPSLDRTAARSCELTASLAAREVSLAAV